VGQLDAANALVLSVFARDVAFLAHGACKLFFSPFTFLLGWGSHVTSPTS